MISDGCKIAATARIERSVLSPGVQVKEGAVVRQSIILTDTVIESGAIVERAIIDKRVLIGEEARVGAILAEDSLAIAMVGKNSQVPPGFTVEAGAVIATDVIPSDYPASLIRRGDYIQTKRLPYEV